MDTQAAPSYTHIDPSWRRADFQKLQQYVAALYGAVGIPVPEAKSAAEAHCTADLWGVESHGVIALPRYLNALAAGKINPRPDIRLERETALSAVLHGDRGHGHVLAYRGMALAIEKAKAWGLGLVGVSNSSHFGMAGFWAYMAVREGLIGLVACATPPVMAPTNAVSRGLGTNPIAIGIPAKEETPIILDMACTAAAMGKLGMVTRRGLTVPLGWYLDEQGKLTDDIETIRHNLLAAPLGGLAETGGHKGYGLSLCVDVLGGILVGANFAPRHLQWDHSQGPSAEGHLFCALQLGLFRNAEEVRTEVDELIRFLHGLPKAPGKDCIFTPGQRELERQQEYLAHGIPLHPDIWASLKQLSQQFEVEMEVDR